MLSRPGRLAGCTHFEIVAYYRKILRTLTHTRTVDGQGRAHTYKCVSMQREKVKNFMKDTYNSFTIGFLVQIQFCLIE